jgi:hypothetical protein
VARKRTDIETPHVLETSFVVTPAEYPSNIVRESDGVCPEAMGRERTPHRCLAPIHHRRRRRLNILHVWEMGYRAKPWRWIGDRDTGRLGNGGGERR